MKNRILFIPVLFLVFALTMFACGSGGSDGGKADISNGDGTDTSGGSGTTCDSIGGIWSTSGTTSVISESSPGLCNDSVGFWSSSAAITQTGCSLSAVLDNKAFKAFSGAIDGSNISWTGSYPDGGTTTETLSATASNNGNSLSGNTIWSWSDSYENSCSGTSTFSGTKP